MSTRRLEAPGYGQPRANAPRIDERLAPPETRLEYLDGNELFAAPADPPHATRHADLAFVLRASVASGFTAAVDLLTRTDDASDFAPDASIYPSEPDRDGHRQLEEVAFEVTSEQALAVPTKKAAELIQRGVRRVFCILVKQARVLEWSRETNGWRHLLESSLIDDRVFVRPFPVRALLNAAASDEAVAQALLARRHPVIEAAVSEGEARGKEEGRKEGKEEGKEEGKLDGRRTALYAILETRELPLDDGARERIERADAPTLDDWTRRAVTGRSLSDILRSV